MSQTSGKQTVALGIGERIAHIRGVLGHLRAARQRFLEFDLDRNALPKLKEQARNAWLAWEREFAWQWENVEAVLDYFQKPVEQVAEEAEVQEVAPLVESEQPGHRARTTFRKSLRRGGRPRML